jgi:hypothetical protein
MFDQVPSKQYLHLWLHFVINLKIFIWYYKYLYFLSIVGQIWYTKIWHCFIITFFYEGSTIFGVCKGMGNLWSINATHLSTVHVVCFGSHPWIMNRRISTQATYPTLVSHRLIQVQEGPNKRWGKTKWLLPMNILCDRGRHLPQLMVGCF